jgi:hypothetical protein
MSVKVFAECREMTVSSVTVTIISTLVKLVFADDLYERIKARVDHWEETEIAEEEWAFHEGDPTRTNNPKKSKVLHDIKVIGIQCAGWLANLLIELAVLERRTTE